MKVSTPEEPAKLTPEEVAARRKADEKRIIDLRAAYLKAMVDSHRAYADRLAVIAVSPDRLRAEMEAARRQADAIEEHRYKSPMICADAEQLGGEEAQAARAGFLEAVARAEEDLHAGLLAMLTGKPVAGQCDQLMDQLDQSQDTELMGVCMDFYWHYQMLDSPPETYSNIIRLSERYPELAPQDEQVYMTTAWLLWSRWVTWKITPARMPVGQGGDEAAHQFLLRGREHNGESGTYHLKAAKELWGLARYHNPRYYAFMAESLALADEHATDDRTRIESRKLLGHILRDQEQIDQAAEAYRRILEIDPDHELAKRLISDLDAPVEDD